MKIARNLLIVLYLAFSAVVCITAEEKGSSDFVLSQACLGCICDAASGCNATIGCTGDVCGPFRITKDYWTDGGKPSVSGETNADDSAYDACANDSMCASRAVQGYMTKYAQDCNSDSLIDCDDYVRIHQLGGFGCSGALNKQAEENYNICIKTFTATEEKSENE